MRVAIEFEKKNRRQSVRNDIVEEASDTVTADGSITNIRVWNFSSSQKFHNMIVDSLSGNPTLKFSIGSTLSTSRDDSIECRKGKTMSR